MQRGLAAALIVGVVCAVMGAFVVLKGLAFIGDAVSHAAFPGLVIAYLIGIPLYIGGAIAAVATALAIGVVSRRGQPAVRHRRSASCSPGRSRSGVLLFSTIHGYVTDLFGYLLGNILGISATDLIQVAILGAIVLVVVLVLRKELLYATFDPAGAAASGLPVTRLEYLLLAMLGVTIVVSIQAVGIILVVAMLVHACRHRPAARHPLRPPGPRRGRDRGGLDDPRACTCQLLRERGLGRGDRPDRDHALRRGAPLLAADRARQRQAAPTVDRVAHGSWPAG